MVLSACLESIGPTRLHQSPGTNCQNTRRSLGFTIMGAVLFLLLLFLSCSLQLTTSSNETIEFALPIVDGNTFSNPKSFTNWTGVPGFFKLAKVFFTEKNRGKIPKEEILEKTIPVKKLTNFSSEADLYAAWLGHSTVLVRMEGATFITDPIWKGNTSPFPIFSAKRYRPPPMALVDLPKIDFAVISHDHFDHLDQETVKTIDRKNPEMRWYVPLGIKKWMEGVGLKATVVEMNWGENVTTFVDGKPFEIWCLPAQHWGQRGPLDRNEHIGPVEAVEIHKHVRSKMSIGVHWGTYEMGAYEGYMEPKLLLGRLMQEETKKGTKPFETVIPGEIWSQQ